MRLLILATFCALVAAPSLASETRQATLTVTGNMSCQHAGRADQQSFEEAVPLTLPGLNGPVNGEGSYSVRGTLGPYAFSGISVFSGSVRDDTELVLTHGQWAHNGKWLTAAAPFRPTEAQPVVIPLEANAQTVVSFTNVANGPVPCTGEITYRLDFTRETQVWDVTLLGHSRILLHDTFSVYDQAKGTSSPLAYTHGFRFSYQAGVQAVLEKRKGLWQFKSGEITSASLTTDYEQSHLVYKVVKQGCNGCDRISALKGQSISGTSDGKTLTLKWPDPFREAWIDSLFALQCPPGPNLQTCLNKKKMGTRFEWDDPYFLDRASPHNLPLSNGSVSFSDGAVKSTSSLELRHGYTLKRLK